MSRRLLFSRWPKNKYDLNYNTIILYVLFKLSICPSYFKYNPPDFLPQWKTSSSKKRLIFVHTFPRVSLRQTNLVRFRKFQYHFYEYTWIYLKICIRQIRIWFQCIMNVKYVLNIYYLDSFIHIVITYIYLLEYATVIVCALYINSEWHLIHVYAYKLDYLSKTHAMFLYIDFQLNLF